MWGGGGVGKRRGGVGSRDETRSSIAFAYHKPIELWLLFLYLVQSGEGAGRGRDEGLVGGGVRRLIAPPLLVSPTLAAPHSHSYR